MNHPKDEDDAWRDKLVANRRRDCQHCEGRHGIHAPDCPNYGSAMKRVAVAGSLPERSGT